MGLRDKRGKWEYRFMVKGQPVQVVTGLAATERNRKKAEQLEVAHRQGILEGRWGFQPLTPRSFSDAVPEFVDWCKVEYRDKPQSWRRIDTSMVSCKVFFGKQIVSMIRPGDVERYKVWRATGDAVRRSVRDVTIKHDLDNLSVLFQWAVKANYARQNPVREVAKPSDAAAIRQRILTPDEEKIYFAHAKGNLHDVGRLILLQGMRPEEVTRIKKLDVDLDAGVLYIREGKTRAAKRVLQLTQESKAILGTRFASDGPWIFPSNKKPGRPITKLNGPHDRICDKIKIQFVLYDLRHTFATRMIEAGVSEFALAAILGHSSTRVLYRYVHPTQQYQNAAMTVYDALNEAREKRIVQ
jgi:integrase